jgi:hypothetical protein
VDDAAASRDGRGLIEPLAVFAALRAERYRNRRRNTELIDHPRASRRASAVCVRARTHTSAHAARSFMHFLPGFTGNPRGSAFADTRIVIWFLEKKDDLLVCEIRRAVGTAGYEFEIADATGPTTIHCQSSTELIARYLHEHSRLMRDGWRPRAGTVNAPE